MSKMRAVLWVAATAIVSSLAAESACASDAVAVQTLAWRGGDVRVRPVGQFDGDFGFYRPYSYGYSFYRPYYAFYYAPYSTTSLYQPFYYRHGFYTPRASTAYYGGPGFSAFYGSRSFGPAYGYGACGAYGYRAYGFGY